MQKAISSEELSADLRDGSGPFLNGRRAIVGLSLFSAGVMGGIALFQMGILKKIPEPRWPSFDAEKVNGSAEAYSHLAMPDALLGLVSYGATACLAGTGAQSRWKTHPWIPLSMLGKILLDAAIAGKLTADQWTKHRAFCFWCLLTTTASFAVLPFAVPESNAALRELRGNDR
ncbi:MAG: vitamin K epoxide reductase family protein [Bryobacteraceae bacterium]